MVIHPATTPLLHLVVRPAVCQRIPAAVRPAALRVQVVLAAAVAHRQEDFKKHDTIKSFIWMPALEHL